MRTANIQKTLWVLIPLVIFICSIFALPSIDLRGAREKIAVEISSKFHGEVTISHAYLSLFPWPHITLKRARINYPQRGELTFRKIEVYPHLLPLFKRKIVLKRLVFKSSVLDIILPEEATVKENWFLSLLEEGGLLAIPSIEAKGGTVHIRRPGDEGPFFTLQDAQGHILPREGGNLECNLRFTCSAADMVEITASVSGKSTQGNGSSFLIRGGNVKVEDVRELALALMGGHETVRETFGILLGGTFSHISCSGEGKDLTEALDIERNVIIRGTLSEGSILAPAGPLPLEGASGDFEIVHELLRGWNIETRLGNSVARKGTIVIGLTSERDEFFLDSEVEADAADIVSYLPKVLTKRELQREIRRFHTAEGWIKGRLTLGNDINDIHPKVESHDFNLSFRHELFPWPLSLRGKDLSLKDGILTWESAKQRLGRSTMYHGEGRVALVGMRPSLEFSFRKGHIALDEIGKWVKAHMGLERMEFIRGEIELRNFGLKAVFNPFQAEDICFQGRRGNVIIHPSFSPSPLLAKGVEVSCVKGGRLKRLKNGQIKALGKLMWKTGAITWGSYRWTGVEGFVTFTEGGTGITVTTGDLCGITSQGTIFHGHDVTILDLRFKTEEDELSSTISCLWGKSIRIEGRYSLEAQMEAEGEEDAIRENSRGKLLFYSHEGRIYHWTLLSRLFSLLNVVGIVTGELPDFKQKGFSYNKFIIKGEVKNGYLHLKEAVIDGPGMKIVGDGKIDLFTGEADFVVLMAPLKTVDVIMHNIPIFGRILTGKSGTFISIPFSITGPINDPKVTPLSPTAVGSGLWGVLKRTLETPVEMIKPVLPKEKTDKTPGAREK